MRDGFSASGDGFSLHFAGRIVILHCPNCPAVVTARGKADVAMSLGNFTIADDPVDHRIPTRFALADESRALLSDEDGPIAELRFEDGALSVQALAEGHDRLTVSFHAEAGEAVWGGGEQFSYLALAGRRFPMWTSEPGVGRDPDAPQAALTGHGTGDYWTTNFPQPTFLTSRWLAVHCDTSAYSVLDFTDPAAHRVEVWSGATNFEFFAAKGPAELVGQLSSRFGRQPPLPDWAIGGAVVGLKDGTSSFDRLERFVEAGAAISGIWCEDWAGIRETSFGRRLFWDWRRSEQRYPDLPARIAALKSRGIHFLAYANPYLAIDGLLYEEGLEGEHYVRDADGTVLLTDFGEFTCASLDFTREETCAWFAERVLGKEMLDIGISGWMADFGEYIPADARFADGTTGLETHNRYPVLWAEVNERAVASRGQTGEAVFFMRSGFSGVQKHCALLWAGDQSVDFSRHDGIGTVITATLSAGLLGNAYSHSDCGGYTSLHGNVRSAEVMRRWCEMAAFAPFMRSHEGNRPDDNLQYDSKPELLQCFARWSRVHAHLAPYTRHLCDEAAASGLPVQRPLFLHYPDDPALWTVQDAFLYGADLLVAPVIEEGAMERDVVLPGTQPWRHVWSGEHFAPGTHTITAPLDRPPVFYRPGSAFAALFADLPAVLAR